jgi:hypothetical protein
LRVYGDSVDDTGFKVIGGWRPLDWLAVEANHGPGGDNGGSALIGPAVTVSALLIAELASSTCTPRHGHVGHQAQRVWAITFR